MPSAIRVRYCIGLLLLAFIVQGTSAILRNSITLDEPWYLLSGSYYWETGDHSLNSVHPPLMKYLYAIPFRMTSSISDQDAKWIPLVEPVRKSGGGDALWSLLSRTSASLYRITPTPFLLARAECLALALGILILIGSWSYSLYGIHGALFSLSLAAFDPTLLAHGSLATLDVPVTFFSFLGLFFFWTWKKGQRRALSLSIALAASVCAVSTKLSGWLVLPIAGLQLVLASPLRDRREAFTLSPGENVFFSRLASKWPPRFSHLFFGFTLWTLALVGTVYFWYGFRSLFLPIESFPHLAGYFPKELRTFPLPVPKELALGLDRLTDVMVRGWATNLLGYWSQHAHWYSYPLVFLIKTPIPLLLAGILSLTTLLRSKTDEKQEFLFLVFPFTAVFLSLYFIASSVGGVRYLVFALPFLFVFCGRLATSAHRPAKYFVVILALWNTISSLGTASNYLAYLNDASRAAPTDRALLCGADFEWGQNLFRVKSYLKGRNIERVSTLRPQDFWWEAYSIPFREASLHAPFETPFVVHVCARDRLFRYSTNSPLVESLRKAESVHKFASSWLIYENREGKRQTNPTLAAAP